MADLLRETGLSPAAAARRARLLYGADVGLYEIRRALGAAPPDDRELRALVAEVVRVFLAAPR